MENKKKLISKLDKSKLPEHIAIIMDGNGRWAKLRGLPRVAGHRAGVNAVKKIVKFSKKIGIKYLTLFAFSTENWQRPKQEVNALMRLLKEYINKEIPTLIENNIKLIVIGRELEDSLQKEINKACELTKNNDGLILTIALNYSGRAEIIDAVKKIINNNVSSDSLNEENFKNFLYTKQTPDPDLLIRTSGENRISNFLLYQIAYTEIYTTPKLWPDFDEAALVEAILEYQKRERRFGKIPTI
jgi:undecaprenyl diphosphate synthase